MRYLTYDEYKEIGGECDLTAFNRNIDRACGIITNETHGRVKAMSVIPEEVKALCRDLIEYLSEHASKGNTVSSRSQSSGGVSESESYTVTTKEEQQNDIANMVCDYLLSVEDGNGTLLLYRGCAR